jgi:peptidoglycan-N-acetylglucosamine deacetylase
MRRISVLAAAGAVVLTVGLVGYGAGRALRSQGPAAETTRTQAAEPDMVTGSIASRPITSPADPKPSTTAVPSVAPAARSRPPSPTSSAEPHLATCAGNPDALGVSRVVEIDTAGGPGFGFEHFKAYDFLEPGEVVLTFDDGPWPVNTPAVLAALAAQCIKATFFPIGKHATWHPEILKLVAAQGHTIGSHTWSHIDLSKKSLSEAKEEIEKGISAVATAAGRPMAPFFRFPALRHTPELMAYLAERNIGAFSTDLDSFDFKMKKPEQVIVSVMGRLKKLRKGIILMHDFQHTTGIALPELLVQLKANGYKVVQLKAKDVVATLPQYDAMMAKAQGGQTVDARPTGTVVRTIGGYSN